MSGTHASAAAEPPPIIDVWADNLDQEMERIIHIVDEYPYVAMDTEFPGVVARPLGGAKQTPDYNYQMTKCNVDLLKIIQLGLAFFNDKGERYPHCLAWQFNFQFSLKYVLHMCVVYW
jgi:CCR4-NOT transcription complex subunit 7/8